LAFGEKKGSPTTVLDFRRPWITTTAARGFQTWAPPTAAPTNETLTWLLSGDKEETSREWYRRSPPPETQVVPSRDNLKRQTKPRPSRPPLTPPNSRHAFTNSTNKTSTPSAKDCDDSPPPSYSEHRAPARSGNCVASHVSCQQTKFIARKILPPRAGMVPRRHLRRPPGSGNPTASAVDFPRAPQ